MKIFYDHLVLREEITVELDRYSLNKDDREEIIRLIDETLHHEVLNTILTSLPKEKHHQFLTRYHQRPHDPDLLEYLKTEISDIEDQIISVAKKVKKEILSEIKKSL